MLGSRSSSSALWSCFAVSFFAVGSSVRIILKEARDTPGPYSGPLPWTSTKDHSACRRAADNFCEPRTGEKKVLITGAPGCGTHSAAALFRLNGIDLGHEHMIRRDGTVSWPYAIDVRNTSFIRDDCVSGNESWNFLQPSPYRYRHVFQLVRCPIEAISSFLAGKNCSRKYMDTTLNLRARSMDSLSFAARAWLGITQHVESYAEGIYRIDRMTDMWKSVCTRLGLPRKNCSSARLPIMHFNKRHHRHITWAELHEADSELAQTIHDLAVRYGFGPACTDDAFRLSLRPRQAGSVPINYTHTTLLEELEQGENVTEGIPGADCDGQSGISCSDDMLWVWKTETLNLLYSNLSSSTLD
eukprot:gnl/TRDRNA2_/TRDRNA2_85058_c0_seq2.p1 gnl/TRDRNA2_/TRDRNA2_85058_c0~~gnl/TRDRNA2_/TRDRNA2_85058_c0_seq2.p1  ORF type:complete len:357 (-),score=19.81 gnl/TRDRNA2_/TRDRNA2_85058_c0_seq2:118-1188(-)